jgi:hypothetical protein
MSFGLPVECRACGAELQPEDAVAMWVTTPLGLTNLKACPGPCESIAVQSYPEQPARRVTLKPTLAERLRAGIRNDSGPPGGRAAGGIATGREATRPSGRDVEPRAS